MTDQDEYLIVTKNDGLVMWLESRGIKGKVVTKATPEDVVGKVVIGAIPLTLSHLAKELVSVDMVKLNSLGEMEGALTRYRVTKIEPGELKYVGHKILAYLSSGLWKWVADKYSMVYTPSKRSIGPMCDFTLDEVRWSEKMLLLVAIKSNKFLERRI